ncbi:MAG: hypothetical protein WCO00_08460 [Rhodospirillaceae bacterium]
MFDFLKILVPAKKVPPKPKAESAVIQVDSRSYPLVTLNAKGFVAGNHDASIAQGQLASITVAVDDRWGKFTFSTRVTITSVNANQQFGASFGLIAPEIEKVLATYAKNRKATPAAKKA